MRSEQLAWLIRRHAVEMTHLSGGSHIGAILSVADIVAVLFTEIMHFRAPEPKWSGRDRFILSKGHAGAAIYAALAECGFFPTEELKTHYQNGSRLSGHVSHHLPGVDFSTGALGHGLSAGTGMALAAKMDGKLDHRVFVVLGDGECNEGSVWEAALFARHFGLGNLVAIIDHNHMQSLDWCEKTLKMESLADKWKSFDWDVKEIDGHDHELLKSALISQALPPRPTVVIANTIKGKGVSFMENDILWHYRFPHDGWEYDYAVNELHQFKPDGVVDPYTPTGIPNPQLPPDGEGVPGDHTMCATYHPSFVEV
ncbi:MAG: transketolase [Victivallales bacterium]|nr:transketolase [Victivallales bacterium]